MSEVTRPVLFFDGVESLVDLGKRPEHAIARDITIEAWVYATAETKWAGVVSRIWDTGTNESGYGICLNGQRGYFGAFVTTTGPSGNFDVYRSSGADTLPLNEWHHVALTYDGAAVRLYVDGDLRATFAQTGAILYTFDNALTIGVYRDDNERIHFTGRIAEVRLWSVVRTQAEVTATMSTPLAGDEHGLVGYWPLDEGEGAAAHDRSATLAHGTIVAGLWEVMPVPFAVAPPHPEPAPPHPEPAPPRALEPANVAPRSVVLRGAALRRIQAVTHEGKVLLFGIDAAGRVHYSVRQSGFESSALAGASISPGFEDWRLLPLAATIDDPSVRALEEATLTTTGVDQGGDPRPAEPLLRSRYAADDPGADPEGALALVSGLGHLYVFRQSRQGALLANRFILDGMTNQLVPKLEVRFQRSRQRHRPRSTTKRSRGDLQDVDTLGFKDIEKNNFYEPAVELSFIKGVDRGRFAVVLVPTADPDVSRWHIFHWDEGAKRLVLNSVCSSRAGLFDLRDRQILGPAAGADGARYSSASGIVTREIELDGRIVVDRFGAAAFHRQVEIQSDSGSQLCREGLQVMVAAPVADEEGVRTTAALCFAVGIDGELSRIERTPRLEDLRSIHREVLLPLNDLDGIRAYASAQPLAAGSVSGLHVGPDDRVLLRTESVVPDHLGPGGAIEVKHTRSFDGLHRVVAAGGDAIEIEAALRGREPGAWAEVRGHEAGLVFDGMITGYEVVGANRIRVICASHDLVEGDEVQISGLGAYDGTHTILEVDGERRAITLDVPWRGGEVIDIKSIKRRGLCFDGAGDYLLAEGVPRPPADWRRPFARTLSCWLNVASLDPRGQCLVMDRDGLVTLRLDESGRVEASARLSNGESLRVVDPSPLVADPRRWIHYTLVLTYEAAARESACRLYRDGRRVENVTPPAACLRLDGAGHLVGPGPEIAATDAYSVELWFRPEIMTQPISTGLFRCSSKGGAALQIELNGKGLLRLRLPDDRFVWIGKISTEWQHLAVCYAMPRLTVYLDGALVAALDDAAARPSGFARVELGRGLSLAREPRLFRGGLAEVRLWDRCLEPEEVVARMRRRVDPGATGLRACWPLDERAGTRAGEAVSGAALVLKGGGRWGDVGPRLVDSRSDLRDRLFSPSPYHMARVVLASAGDLVVEAPISTPPARAARTLEAWFFADQELGALPIVSRSGPAPEEHRSLAVGPDGRLAVEGGGASWRGTRRLHARRWYHVAVTFGAAGEPAGAWIDGAAERLSDAAPVEPPIRPVAAVRLAADFRGRCGRVMLCDVRVWARERTSDEIAAALYTRHAGIEADLIGLWPLEHAALHDFTSYRNHAAPRAGRPAFRVCDHLFPEPDYRDAWSCHGGPLTTLTDDPAAPTLIDGAVNGLCVELWCRPQSGGSACLLELLDDGAPPLRVHLSDDLRVAIEVTPGHLEQLDVALPLGQWTHVAITLAADGALSSYLNGSLEQEVSTDGARLERSAITLGGWAGEIAEVRVWNKVRTQAEVREALFTAIRGARPNLAACWSGSSSGLSDHSGRGHHIPADGASRRTSAPTLVRAGAAVDVIIGARLDGDGPAECLRGRLSDVRVWEIGLDDDTVRDQMCVALSGAPRGLAANWRLGGIFDDGDVRFAPDFSPHEIRAVVYGDVFVGARSLPRRTAKDLDVALFRNDDLVAVSPRGLYRETFELRLDGGVDPEPYGAAMAELFVPRFWGKASRVAEAKLPIVAEHVSITPIGADGWYRVESQLVIPESVRLLRLFELAVRPLPGFAWEVLEVRKHRLINVSDAITRERYREAISLPRAGGDRREGDARLAAVVAAEQAHLELVAAITSLTRRLDALADKIAYQAELDQLRTREVELRGLLAVTAQKLVALDGDVTKHKFRIVNNDGKYWRVEGTDLRVGDAASAQIYTCTHLFGNTYDLLIDGRVSNPAPMPFPPQRCRSAGGGRISLSVAGWRGWSQIMDSGGHSLITDGNFVCAKKASMGWSWKSVGLISDALVTFEELKRRQGADQAELSNNLQRQSYLAGLLGGQESPAALTLERDALRLEVPGRRAALDAASAALVDFIRAQQARALTMPELRRDARGLATLGLELTYVDPAGPLHVSESVEGEVHLSYVDAAGRMRLTRYDATADARNAAFEQWIPDGLRACPDFSASAVELRFARPLALPEDLWTVEVWFQHPLPEGAGGEYQLLVGRDASNGPLVVKRGGQLGSLIDGYFLDSGVDLDVLAPGWHHLAVTARRGASRFYVDGLAAGREAAARVRDVLGLQGAQDGVRVEDLTTFPTERFTVDFWIKTTAATGCIFAYGGELRLSDPGALKLRLFADVALAETIAINDGYWHHVVLTWNNESGELRLIVDGQRAQLVTQHAVGKRLTAGADLLLGQAQDAEGGLIGGAALSCELHAFSLWDKDLPARDGHAPIIGDEPHLAGHWSMQTREETVIRSLPGGVEEEEDIVWVVDARAKGGHHGVLLGGASRTLPPAFSGDLERAAYSAGGAPPPGRLAELRVWSSALADDELLANSNVALTGYEPELLHYYPLDEAAGATIRDRAVNDPIHASLGDARWVACTAPIGATSPHRALRTRSLVSVDRIPERFAAGITCECWLFVAEPVGEGVVGELFAQRHRDPTVAAFQIRIIGGTHRVQVGFDDTLAGWRGVEVDVPLPLGTWIHVAVAFDRRRLQVFFGGELVADAEGTPYAFSGRRSPWALADLKGSQYALTEVRVWNYRRSREEIAGARECPLTGREGGLVGYWDTQDAADGGPRVRDRAGARDALVHGPVDRVACPPLSAADGVVTCEYATIGVDPRDLSAKQSMMRRLRVFSRGGAVNVWHGQRIEEMTLTWVGNAQFNPTLVGYIEGAPPVPSENLTVMDTYVGATSVLLSQSEDIRYSWSMSRDRSSGASLDMFAGVAWDVSAGAVVQTTLTSGRVGARANVSMVDATSRASNISAESTVTKIDSIKLTGATEDKARFPTIGPRFVPKNVGYAQVISGMADVFLVKLKRSGRMISYDIQPVPGVPLDVNTITFMINPAYQMSGSLDGTIGAMAADERFYGHVPEMRAQYGSLYPASYFRVREAYALKEQIERMDAEREAYFRNFDANVAGFAGPSLGASGGAGVGPVDGGDAPDEGAMSDEEREQSQAERKGSVKSDSDAMGRSLSGQADEQRGAIAGVGASPEEEAASLAQLESWQARMEGLLTRAGKRNIVNTYVWDADGGLYAEEQSFASTVEHTIGGSFSMDWGAGLELDVTAGNVNLMLTALYSGSMSQTLSKTESSSTGFSLNVDLSGVEGSGVTDSRDYPLSPGVKVDRYRMMSFFLEGATRHFEDFFDYVVDPEWLASNDEEARALRMARAGRPNKTWRVLHRVTYVERPALMGFGEGVRRPVPAAADVIAGYMEKLTAHQLNLQAQMDDALDILRELEPEG
ncbi:MAG: hypothetical protein IPK80_28425 [Nannocystis sp.]|nr:hypothetical protein [Nannocystis sp.]